MRARSIKPGICANELLGVADPFCTLLFERLWMMADREGRLEDRPLRIKALAFPYRNADVDALLAWLAANAFISRYEVSGQKYIQINEFRKHQSPHVKEAASTIPAPCLPGASPVKPRGKTRLKSVPVPESPAPAHLTPDSGLLTPDSNIPETRLVLHESLPEAEWDQWLEKRRKKHWPMDATTLRKQLEILAEFDTDTQRRMLNNSMQSSWQGVFPLKGGERASSRPRERGVVV